MTEPVDFVINLPTKETPGFLRRQRTALRFMKRLQTIDENPDPAVIDDLLAFLLPFVEEPSDPAEVEELLLDFSEEQFMQVLTGIIGAAEDADKDIPPTKGKKSKATT